MTKPARFHAIERVSPKGPGHQYIGTCWQCGKTGLTLAGAREPCENIAGLTEDQSLVMAVWGPDAEPGEHQEVLDALAACHSGEEE